MSALLWFGAGLAVGFIAGVAFVGLLVLARSSALKRDAEDL